MLTETITPDGSEAAAAPPLDGGPGRMPGLAVSGVVLTKGQLLAALGAFVPNATDFVPLPDGEHFSILFGGDSRRTDETVRISRAGNNLELSDGVGTLTLAYIRDHLLP